MRKIRGEISNVPTTVATRFPVWDRRRATRASLGYQADSTSKLEKFGNLLIHGLAERLIHLGGLKGKSRETSRILQAGSRSAGNQLQLSFAFRGVLVQLFASAVLSLRARWNASKCCLLHRRFGRLLLCLASRATPGFCRWLVLVLDEHLAMKAAGVAMALADFGADIAR